jgi:hypothetical protein
MNGVSLNQTLQILWVLILVDKFIPLYNFSSIWIICHPFGWILPLFMGASLLLWPLIIAMAHNIWAHSIWSVWCSVESGGEDCSLGLPTQDKASLGLPLITISST